MSEFEDPYATIDDTVVQKRNFADVDVLDIPLKTFNTQRNIFPSSDVSDLYTQVVKPAKSQPTLYWRDHMDVNGVSYAVVNKKGGSTYELDYYDNNVDDVIAKPTSNTRCLSEGNSVDINGDIYAVINKNTTPQRTDDVKADDVFVDSHESVQNIDTNGLVVVTDCTSDSDHSTRLESGSSDYYVSMCTPNTVPLKKSFRGMSSLLNESLESLVEISSAPVSPLFQRKCYDMKGSNDLGKTMSTSFQNVQQYTTLRDLCSDSEDSVGWMSSDGYQAITRSLDDVTSTRHQLDMYATIEGIDASARSKSQENTLSISRFSDDDSVSKYGRPRSRELVPPADNMLRKARQKQPLPPPPTSDIPTRTSRLVRLSKMGKLSRKKKRSVRPVEPLPPPPTPPPPSSSPLVRRGPRINTRSPNVEDTDRRRSPATPGSLSSSDNDSLERKDKDNALPKRWFGGLFKARGNRKASSKYIFVLIGLQV